MSLTGAHHPILKWASQEYYDLNGTHYETWDHLPTSLEFSRMVRIARPVLFRASPVPDATIRWTDEYLASRCGNHDVSVAVTPNGRADSIISDPDGKSYFAEPCTEKMPMAKLLSKLLDCHSLSVNDRFESEVLYLQSQNGNIYSNDGSSKSEFEGLRSDVPRDLPWCSEALDSLPEAVNLWIGDDRSVTSIHNDPYENIYVVVRGSKTFTLLPPTEGWCLNEQCYPHAQYRRDSPSDSLTLVPSPVGVPPIRWASVQDPNVPGALGPHAHPIEITVGPGQSLYLPAGWWHYVRQSGVTIAVNYWYDLESRGASWVWLNLLRGAGELPSDVSSKLDIS